MDSLNKKCVQVMWNCYARGPIVGIGNSTEMTLLARYYGAFVLSHCVLVTLQSLKIILGYRCIVSRIQLYFY